MTALKKAEDGRGYILRGYETEGQSGAVRLRIDLPFQNALSSDLAERQGSLLALNMGSFSLSASPFSS